MTATDHPEYQAVFTPRFTQGGLIHILKEVREHTEMAREMGWINT